MINLDQIAGLINLPPITQIGVIVKDLDQAVDFYSKAFGLPPFFRFELAPTTNLYYGEKHPLHLKLARSYWGAMEFELIQHLEGKSIHQDFLESRGEGINHLGIDVTDYEAATKMMDQAGFKPLQAIEVFLPAFNTWAKASFYDTNMIGGIVLEIAWRPHLAKKK